MIQQRVEGNILHMKKHWKTPVRFARKYPLHLLCILLQKERGNMVTCVVRSWHVSFKQPTNLGLHDIWWAKWGLKEPRRPRCARQIFWCFSANLICWAYDSMAKISNSQAVEASPKATTSGNPRYLPVFSFFLAHVSFFSRFKKHDTWFLQGKMSGSQKYKSDQPS